MSNKALLFVLTAVFAVSVAEAEVVNPLDFGKGPAQWLMTRQEQKVWRSIKTPVAAHDFINLFWARRDPTPGTFANEFRDEFERRVTFADKNFVEGKKRGSLTERGRVLVVLGFPSNWTEEQQKRTSYMVKGDSSGAYAHDGESSSPLADPTGGRALAGKDNWVWEHRDALKYKMPKIEVVFIYDGIGGAARRDPLRADFISALPAAIDYYIKSPGLTAVPEWAVRRDVMSASSMASPSGAPAAIVSDFPLGTTTRAAKPAGAGRLSLVRDAFEVDPRTDDPLASLSAVERFKQSEELGWLAEYCSGAPGSDSIALQVGLKISGVVGGRRLNFTAPADEMIPDAMSYAPGCYLVRGAVPLAEVEPGQYELTLQITGPGGSTYNLTRSFQVE